LIFRFRGENSEENKIGLHQREKKGKEEFKTPNDRGNKFGGN
jgi:hypothetical protein